MDAIPPHMPPPTSTTAYYYNVRDIVPRESVDIRL